jgi:hypothetical protein
MGALFALGVMSVPWMVFIAALIATEKLFPWKKLANRAIAVLLALLGLAVALAPGSVPGLTIPADTGMGMEHEPGEMNQGMKHEPGGMTQGMKHEPGEMNRGLNMKRN